MMPNIQITVTDKIATAAEGSEIICGNSDYTVTFTFDSEWGRYTTKTARFNFVRNGVWHYMDVLFDGDTCAIPTLDDVYEVEIGVYAGSIHTSTGARVPCKRSDTAGGTPHADPPPDIYEQLLEYLAGLQGGGATGQFEMNFNAIISGGVLPFIADSEG